MSITDVRPFFRSRMIALGFEEWEDGFDFTGVPETILDERFHIETGAITALPANQRVHTFSMPVVIRLFLKGFRDSSSRLDDGLQLVEDIMTDVLSPANRLGTAGIKDVIPVSITPVPLNIENDESLIMEIAFTTRIHMCF